MTAAQIILIAIGATAFAWSIGHLQIRLNEAERKIESLQTQVWHLYEYLDLISPSPSAAPDEDE